MTIKYLITLASSLLLPLQFTTASDGLVDYVNTRQGTDSWYELSSGNTYATIALPFGMHTWGAQTGTNGDGWKYQYQKDSIRAFQQAHQCSPWANDYNVFSLMPVTGELKLDQFDRASHFSHDNETAHPHYYAVAFDNGINTEISPTERGAHLRFSYPRKQASWLIFDGYVGNSYVSIDPERRRLTGWVCNRVHSHDGGFRNWFVIEFDKPLVSFGTWNNRTGHVSPGNTIAEGAGASAYVEFPAGAVVQVKAASSYISIEQAELNLKSELGEHSEFEDTRNAAAETWNTLLGRILIEGVSEQEKQTFYSCLFRANLFSRKCYEISPLGEPYYRSPEDLKIHDGYFYTDNGFWDTFRAQFPLSNLLHPTQQGRYMQSMLDTYRIFGWLPSWAFPHEGGGMIGNHAISLFADAWAKGIRTFDPEDVLQAYFHEATEKGPRGPANGRDGWKDYYTLGYVSYPETPEATSKTLEYTYDDWCAYQLAKMAGLKFYEKVFSRQIYNYRNVFNPKTGFMMGRNRNGEWNQEFDEFGWAGPFTEGCAWHYLWSVFHDPEGLADLLGGDKAMIAKMDSVWSITNEFNPGWRRDVIHEMTEMKLINMGQYAHGNQPMQHFIYLYNYTSEPWKAQYWARQAMTRLYNGTERGYPGDEDQGQTSSWFVLSAMGLYAVCPGTDQYVFGSPLYPKMTVEFEDGKILEIIAHDNSPENVYIRKVILNGQEISRNYLTYQEITSGGKLEFFMGSEPEKSRGIRPEDRPYSVSRSK